jgi:hypothetical protein
MNSLPALVSLEAPDSLGSIATGSASADGEIASIPAMDATTIALGLMFTLYSTAFTLNFTLPERHSGS